MLRARSPALAAALAFLLTSCGGSGSGDLSRPAPPAADFPAASGRSLPLVLSAASGQGPVVAPNVEVFRKGSNRYGFGVFTLDKKPITNAQVALYAAHGANGKAIGPFPAAIESLQTEAKYQAATTKADPDAAKVIYIAHLPFNANGEWRIGALIRKGSKYQGSLLPSAVVGQFPGIPTVGQRAPRIHTPTSADVGGNLSKIDTRKPHDDMHGVDFYDVLGRKPVVLLFATPALCQSRVCGPVVDIAEQAKHSDGAGVAFIHNEVYNQNDLTKGVRPQMKAFHLQDEPWLFVIDRHGRISTEIEGAFSIGELQQALKKVTG